MDQREIMESDFIVNQTDREVVERLLSAGASECLLVGGCVRDQIMGIPPKDIDIECYGLDYDQIVAALEEEYRVDLVGQSFGIVKVDRFIDVNIPRRESACGLGHKDFTMDFDPSMTPREAAARRDFTINSMAMRIDGEILDFFDGHRDVEAGILRATSARYADDPLRVLRGMQFAARFGFEMDDHTVDLSRSMISGFGALSAERVFGEFWKWAAEGKYPSKGIHILRNTGWIACFPEIGAMLDTPQDPQWHPEGDVLTHTEHCLDAAVEICERRGFDEKTRGIVVLTVLCHDMGKPKTTVLNEHGHITALKHASVGSEVAREFLNKMKAPGWLVDAVVPLTVEHMAHVHRADAFPFKGEEIIEPTERAVRRLARRLEPSNIDEWAAVCEADHSGRPPLPKDNPVQAWEVVAERLAVKDQAPKPILMGRHMMELGMEPGPEMGEVLRQAFERQLDGEFEDIEGAIAWARENLS